MVSVCLALGWAGRLFGAPVTARMADDLVESAGVCTHLTYTDKAYFKQWPVVRQRLLDLGVRHIRDGGTSTDFVRKMQDLAGHGVRTIWILDPGAGITPTSEFWTPSSAKRQLLTTFLKTQGLTQAVSAVEVMNEIDLFYNRGWIADDTQAGYFWKSGNTQPTNHVSNDAASPLWWGRYIVAMTTHTWMVLNGDAATAGIPVIGPSFGAFHDTPPTGANSLRDFVDWGCFHPYPFGGNPFSARDSYAGVDWYIGHGQQPSCNIDEWPMAFTAYQGAYGTKPMAATETGWYTGTAAKAVSEAAQAKYVPRLYLEYFRRGIARTCHYEFLDEGTNPSDNEQNRGLLRADLTPKPAYTALKNMLGLLADKGPAFTPGGLDFTLTRQMPANYSRSQYVRSLLFQKRDGTFWLALWHEVASSSYTSVGGQEIAGVARDIIHPDVKVTLKFNTPIAAAEVYRPNTSDTVGTNYATPQSITVAVNDSPVLLRLSPERPALVGRYDNAGNKLQVSVVGQIGHRYYLEQTSDLEHWNAVTNFLLSDPPQVMEFSGGPKSFYRARTQ